MLDRPPRMDVLGRHPVRGLEAVGVDPGDEADLQGPALVGDLAANTLYYALVAVGSPRRPLVRGAVLGALAGVGAVVLPPRIGLGGPPHGTNPRTQR